MKRIILGIIIFIVGVSFIYKDNTNLVGVYLDNVYSSNIPLKDRGYVIDKIDCDDDIEALWDENKWSLSLTNLSKKTKCNLYFYYDKDKPYWKIESIKTNSVLTTSIFEFSISGEDNLTKISDSLKESDLSFYVGDSLESPVKVEINKTNNTDKKIIYQVKVHMIGGSGKLKVKINSNTLKDIAGNQNDEVILDTGINVSKNTTKILYYYHSTYDDQNITPHYGIVENYYSNVTKTSSYTDDQIKSGGFKLMVFDGWVWGAYSVANTAFNAGINVFSYGNDSESYLVPIESHISSKGMGESTKIYNNALTKYLPETLPSGTDSLRLIKFTSDVKVLYQNTTNGIVYDTMGYLTKNGVTWFHSQYGNAYPYSIPIIEFVLGNLK